MERLLSIWIAVTVVCLKRLLYQIVICCTWLLPQSEFVYFQIAKRLSISMTPWTFFLETLTFNWIRCSSLKLVTHSCTHGNNWLLTKFKWICSLFFTFSFNLDDCCHLVDYIIVHNISDRRFNFICKMKILCLILIRLKFIFSCFYSACRQVHKFSAFLVIFMLRFTWERIEFLLNLSICILEKRVKFSFVSFISKIKNVTICKNWLFLMIFPSQSCRLQSWVLLFFWNYRRILKFNFWVQMTVRHDQINDSCIELLGCLTEIRLWSLKLFHIA